MKYLRRFGLFVVNIFLNVEVDCVKIEKGEYLIVYGLFEVWFMNECW